MSVTKNTFETTGNEIYNSEALGNSNDLKDAGCLIVNEEGICAKQDVHVQKCTCFIYNFFCATINQRRAARLLNSEF